MARDDETPAERAFREALEEVERKNQAKQQQVRSLDAKAAAEALDVLERAFVGDGAALVHVAALRRMVLAALEQKRAG